MEWRVAGESLPRLFERAAAELTSHLLPSEDIGRALREQLVVEAADPAALLAAWMNMLLRLASEQRMVFSRFEVSITNTASGGASALRAVLLGELIDLHRHVFHMDPKNLTCTSTDLKISGSAFEARLRFFQKSPGCNHE
jgi:SHS2 domain-containing protein